MASCLFLKPIKGAGNDLPDVGDYVPDIDVIGHYDLETADLSRYPALCLPAHLDQRFFGSLTAKIEQFLDAGGTLVFNGHVAWPMLPEFQPFVPLNRFSLEDLQIHRLTDHPVFEGVSTGELTYRRGVAGFYARGFNPPPEGAVSLHGVGPDRLPCDWVYERPSGGRIFMHAGNDLWMYVGSSDTTARIAPQLCAWASGKGPQK
ncbi:hypothetical protein B0E33_22550 [Roseibium algicola]|uniref:ThuA-like domain-containing protein n=1 Tax=Roseibium algicola TaxID=2857014 RepID=A0ABN4X007_9HYPH|nr:hypothetical protein [Roseibium aggregatum]AQQ06009.1 hypothetical protein B0E33_22550 [Roseibium aggregatum]